MALPPLATVSDLAAWVGQDIDPGDLRAGAVLSAASTRVRDYAGATWTTDGVLDNDIPDAVAETVVQVAARVWMNPANLQSLTADDVTQRWGGLVGLYLTDADKEALSPYVESAPTGIGTLGVTRGTLGTDTIYVPTAPEPSGPPFPWYSSEGQW